MTTKHMTPKTMNGSYSMQMEAQSSNLAPLAQRELEKELKTRVGWVNSNYEAAKSDRMRFERHWALNMSFFRGRQYMQYFPNQGKSPLAGKLFTPPSPSCSSRTVTHRIRPIIRTEMTRLTSNTPNTSVVPSSNEDFDLFSAQAGDRNSVV